MSILEALQEGSCYASTGVTFDQIDVEKDTLQVTTANADELRLTTDYGCVQANRSGPKVMFCLLDDVTSDVENVTYVRMEALGDGAERPGSSHCS